MANKIQDWAGRLLGVGKVIEQRVSEVRRGAYQQGFREGQDYSGDVGEDEPVSGTTARYGYRRSTAKGLRDFHQIDRETIIEIMWTLWQSNPVADRSMEIKRDYILGRGVQFNAEDADLQQIIDDFVEDNEFNARLKEFVLQLYLFGSQCYPVYVRKTDGRVQFGYFDPAEIESVIPHPDNALKMWAVVIKESPQVNAWEKQQEKRVYRIVRREDGAGSVGKNMLAADSSEMSTYEEGEVQPVGEALQSDSDIKMGRYVTAGQAQLEEWETKFLEEHGLQEYSGSAIYVKVNSVSNQPYGWSDLLQSADWLDQIDETLFSVADREQLRNYFSWDVSVEGATAQEVRERANEIYQKPPKKGSVNVHGQGEQWSYTEATLGQTESIETVRAMLLHVYGGLGYPEHWYGRGDETNRATAQAQGDPTWRTLEHDQDAVRDMILWILNFVRDQAVIAGTWSASKPVERTPGVQEDAPEERSEEITVTMPEMTASDMNTTATTMSTTAGALVVAQEQGWQTREQSREIWSKVVSELGIEIDTSEDIPVPEPEPGMDGQPLGQRSATHGIAWDGSGENGQSRSWGELTRTEQQEVVASTMERNGIEVELDDVAEVLDNLERQRAAVGVG